MAKCSVLNRLLGKRADKTPHADKVPLIIGKSHRRDHFVGLYNNVARLTNLYNKHIFDLDWSVPGTVRRYYRVLDMLDALRLAEEEARAVRKWLTTDLEALVENLRGRGVNIPPPPTGKEE